MNSQSSAGVPAGHPVRLIVTDLDGTFLGSDGMPSQANCDAVFEAASVGVPTIFATGRPARWLQVLDRIQDAHPLVIASNGALVVDLVQRTVIDTFPLDIPTTTDVITDVQTALPGAAFAVEYVHGWGRDQLFPIAPDKVEAEVIVHQPQDLLVRDEPIKLLIRSGMPTLDLMAQVAPIVEGRLNLTFSVVQSSGFVELSRPDVSKGSTLATLLDQWAIPPQDVAAFGDMPNDLDMLDLVGHPFVMGNGHEVLKQRGFPVCGHHDESAFATTVTELLGLETPFI